MDEALTRIFEFHRDGRANAGRIASRLDLVLAHFLKSSFGQDFENLDGFKGTDGTISTALDHHVSTIRQARSDQHQEDAELIVDVFAEGRITVIAQRRSAIDQSIIDPSTKTLYFAQDEPSESIAARVLSAIADSSDNLIADQIDSFLSDQNQSMNASPASAIE